jgi:hypothetical protein
MDIQLHTSVIASTSQNVGNHLGTTTANGHGNVNHSQLALAPPAQAPFPPHYALSNESQATLNEYRNKTHQSTAVAQGTSAAETTRHALEIMEQALAHANSRKLSPTQAARLAGSMARTMELNHVTVLQHLPEALRLPYFLDHARFHEDAGNVLAREINMKFLPLYDAVRAENDNARRGVSGKLKEAAKLMRRLETTSGEPKRQIKVLADMQAFALGLPGGSELRYAMFSTTAANFDRLKETKTHALHVLDVGFNKPATLPNDVTKLWRTDALSTLLSTSFRHMQSTYSAKMTVNIWRDQMLDSNLTANQKQKLTLDLIAALPHMGASMQALTSRYNPQAKALKYLDRLIDQKPLIRNDPATKINVTLEERIKLTAALVDMHSHMHTGARNLSMTNAAAPEIHNRLMLGITGAIAGGVIGGLSVIAAGPVLPVLVIGGGVVMAASTTGVQAPKVFQGMRNESNKLHLLHTVSHSLDNNKPLSIAANDRVPQAVLCQSQCWKGLFENIGELSRKDQQGRMNTFRTRYNEYRDHPWNSEEAQLNVYRAQVPAYAALAKALPHFGSTSRRDNLDPGAAANNVLQQFRDDNFVVAHLPQIFGNDDLAAIDRALGREPT